MWIKHWFWVLALTVSGTTLCAQSDEDALAVRRIFDTALTQGSGYEWLRYLCKEIGPRASGTKEGAAAVKYTKAMLDSLQLDKVWLQEVTVPHWERGDIETAQAYIDGQAARAISVAALGFSAATPKNGLRAPILEVQTLDELKALPASKVKGKIVFFNRPMEATLINTFHAYGQAVDQRVSGPKEASKKGAIACLVRSMTLKHDDVPHSGVTYFRGGVRAIPAVGIGLESADWLSTQLKAKKNLEVSLTLSCQRYSDKKSHNVIAEIKGSKYPNEVIVVGGHLDSWDIGEGAHDDGAGCVQAMEVLHLFKRMNIKPQRTIRCVLFANEESGLRGAKAYAKWAKVQKETHIAAIESDAGGHAPRGFAMDGLRSVLDKNYSQAQAWRALIAPYGAYFLDSGGSGADITPLKGLGTLLFGFRPDSQRYFDYHHARTDVFETVNRRELELGAASMTALVYLIDLHGVK